MPRSASLLLDHGFLPTFKLRQTQKDMLPAMKRVLLLLSLALFACHRERAHSTFANAPVILISIDTLRADHLPLYGYTAIKTPNIDALRRDGILFENAYSHCPMTLPSHISMLTG